MTLGVWKKVILIDFYIKKNKINNSVSTGIFSCMSINLPIIVKPKPYSKNKLGYLLNDVRYDDELIVDKMAYGNKSEIIKKDFYSVVNNMMNTLKLIKTY